MKTELPKPFYTARVGEALSSLTNYVREASRIADEIKPVLSSDSPLKPDPDAVPPAPKLHDVQVTTTTPSGVPANISFWVTVNGQNLENIHSFALIPAHDLRDGRYSTNAFFNPTSGQSLHHLHPTHHPLPSVLAGFTQHQAPPRASGTKKRKHHYHGWVQDSFGQEDLLFNALEV
jgi:hypothetical protein